LYNEARGGGKALLMGTLFKHSNAFNHLTAAYGEGKFIPHYLFQNSLLSSLPF
jgi:hypothetical protein